MKALTRILLLSAFALVLVAFLAPSVSAQIPEASFLRLNEPLDVGGTVLQPGVYVIRVVPTANRNFLQVTNEDRSKVFVTVLSIPHPIPANTEQKMTEYVYYPAVAGAPLALRTWYAPDATSHGGHDIVYPQRRATELAALANEPVVAYKDETKAEELESADLVVVTPQKSVVPYVAPKPAPVKAAELPHTASSLPLFALFGMLLLGAAAGLRLLRAV